MKQFLRTSDNSQYLIDNMTVTPEQWYNELLVQLMQECNQKLDQILQTLGQHK